MGFYYKIDRIQEESVSLKNDSLSINFDVIERESLTETKRLNETQEEYGDGNYYVTDDDDNQFVFVVKGDSFRAFGLKTAFFTEFK